MRLPLLPLVVAALALALPGAFAAHRETAELNFDRRFEKANALANPPQPAWIQRVEQSGGRFLDDPRCWLADALQPEGVGRITITLDRRVMKDNLVATLLFDAAPDTDFAVQLFDAAGRVIVVDLFGNLVDVSKEVTTDTFVIPLTKYPTAEKIVLRRIKGDLRIYGCVLYPVVTEGEADPAELAKLARVLGDPLSPENPLVKGLRAIAKNGSIPLVAPAPPAPPEPAPTAPDATPAVRKTYPGAVPPRPGFKAGPPPTDGLVAHWDFENGSIADTAGGHHGTARGDLKSDPGIRGSALHLNRFRRQAVLIPPAPDLDLKDTLTVTAWVNYTSIAPRWGSQIVWFGDDQLGRDPWVLNLLPDATLQFRTDRSVTGKPKFIIFDNELKLSPDGEPMLNQHVAVWSPDTLAPRTWYFVAGTIEKLGPRLRSLKLYLNGEPLGETRTEEIVNYDTTGMHTTLGAVDDGTWQNFDGSLDEVRVYNRALTAAEIKTLYQQPRK